MRVIVGEQATARLLVDVQYRCSSCGKDNLATETLKGSAYTPTLMGFNVVQNLTDRAKDKLIEKLANVSNKADPHRFRAMGFTCICKYCGNVEPWANMTYSLLKELNAFSLVILFLSIFLSFFSFGAGEFNYRHFLLFAILALSAATCIGISIYINKNYKKMEQLIAVLPQESLPTILPYSKERHDVFNRVSSSHTPDGVVYDKWVCRKCGTQNSKQYSQCKKCGKYKNA